MKPERLPRVPTALLAAALLALAVAATASGDSLLPDAHEAEHRAQAAAAEHELDQLALLSPALRERLRERVAATRRRALAVPAEEGGAWSAPFPHRAYGMHTSLLATGKVLFWSSPVNGFNGARPNAGLAWLWDPAQGTGPDSFMDVDPPLVDSDGDGTLERAPLWCSGQSFLPDGRLLATGGNRQWPDWAGGATNFIGWEGVLTFNPWNETWARQPDMAAGRWYPSQVLTGRGETFVVAGYTADPLGGVSNTALERFTPSAGLDGTHGRMDILGSPTGTSFGNYPHLFTLRSGEVAAAGQVATDVALLDPATGVWDRLIDQDGVRPLMSRTRFGGTAVLEPAGPGGEDIITGIGGWQSDPPLSASSATTETIDFSPPTGEPRWQPGESLHVARAYHNTVLLPDGGMVTVGGGSGRSDVGGVRAMYDDGRSRAVELRDAGSSSWRLGAAQAEDRGYHSTAVLLPDGRVLSAGDDIHPDSNGDTIELYSPPYLFKGDRPVISGAPAAVDYGQSFDVSSSTPDVLRAVLMAPSATTHAADMTQRHVELLVEAEAAGGGLRVRAPAHGNLAPPGYYMLFLLDSDGVPSVARWVRLRPSIDQGVLPGVDAAPAENEVPPAADQPRPEPPRAEPPRPVPPAVRDGLPPTVRLRVDRAALRAARRSGRLRFSVSVDERAAIEAHLTARGTLLGALRVATMRAGTRSLVVRVPAARRRLLRRRPVTLTVTARDAAANSRRARLRLGA